MIRIIENYNYNNINDYYKCLNKPKKFDYFC